MEWWNKYAQKETKQKIYEKRRGQVYIIHKIYILRDIFLNIYMIDTKRGEKWCKFIDFKNESIYDWEKFKNTYTAALVCDNTLDGHRKTCLHKIKKLVMFKEQQKVYFW